MHFTKKRLIRSAGFGVGLILTASLALAGEATFNLPVETHFGQLTLSPGSYRIITPTATTSIRAVYLYGNGKLQATLPLSVDTNANSARSYLQLVNVNGVYFARTYNAAIAGESFTFDIPKKFRREALASLRATSVPVNASGNE